jgi:[NiFe] hydrogenase diaphorase moiety large subunit
LNKVKVDQMVDLIEAQTPLSEWPEEFFKVRNNIQRKHILLGEYFEPGAAIKVLLERGPEAILTELKHSGLRGCGGAGFKTETKWTLCRNTPAETRYVVCNADEGEPGTFKDRIIMQSYADLMFEGMTLCAGIIGAKRGFLYLRGEYRYLLEPLKAVLARRRQQGLLGEKILGRPDFSFDIEIHLGAGAYVCGAEIALIESLQGHRGVPLRRPPPFPVTEGYLGQPTVVNNVETLALAAKIATYGGKRFAKLGTKHSKGTKLLSVCGDCDRPGVYEFPFGVTIREVLDACGAQDTQAVQNSGPAGHCLSAADFDKQLCFEALNTTGSIMIFNQQRNILEIVRSFAQFFVHESCGFCTPCRIGTSLLKNLIEKVYQGNGTQSDLEELVHLSQIIKTTSHCGLGMTSANHIEDTLAKFPGIYSERLKESTLLVPAFDLDAALEEAREITHRTDDASAHW